MSCISNILQVIQISSDVVPFVYDIITQLKEGKKYLGVLSLIFQSTSYVITVTDEVADIVRLPGFDDVAKSLNNVPKLR